MPYEKVVEPQKPEEKPEDLLGVTEGQEGDTDMPEAPPSPIKCPRCGWRIFRELPEATDEDKKQFLRAMLTEDARFEKAYSLFNGNVTVCFRSRSLVERELVANIISATVESSTPTQTPLAVMHTVERFRLAAALKRIRVGSSVREFNEPVGDNLTELQARHASFDNWKAPLYDAVITQLRMFDALWEQVLTGGADKPDFWKTIGQDSQSEQQPEVSDSKPIL